MQRSQVHGITMLVAAATVAALGALPAVSFAQASKKPIRIGILVAASVEQRGALETALAEGLREKGYVEGTNLVIERRYTNGVATLLPEYARQLADLRLDAIVTTCTDSTRGAKEATSATPIVMAAVADPVGQHLIASLSKPGNNITGLSSQAEDVLAKGLELLAGVLGKSTPIAVFSHTTNPVHELMWPKLDSAAQQLQLKLVRVDITRSADLPGAFDVVTRAQAGAIFVLPDDPFFFNIRRRIVDLAAKNHVPDFYSAAEFVEAGGLMSYGENMRGSYFHAASYIDKVANGAKPASLPVAQPTRFELAINLATAKALGVTIPQSLLLRADEVIQ